MRETELLILVGSLDVLKIVAVFGVGAVYIGGEALGLRAKTYNLSRNDMKERIASVRVRGTKVYVTANTLVHNGDLPGVEAYPEELKEIGPDIPIISDLDVSAAAKKALPGTEIHISIQANNTNYSTCLFWHKLGVRRVMTTRELSLDEIRKVREHIPEDMEIESLIYGAIYIFYSGRCPLSNFFVGRDANQGICTHPRWWRYPIVEETRPGEYMLICENERGTYIPNSKDLYMIGHIPEMMGAGIGNFKIEGRVKTALYVTTVARTYKKAIDDHKKDPQLYRDRMEWYRREIEKCTYREFTAGFHSGKPIENAQIYDNNTYTKSYVYLGTVLEVDGRGRRLIQQKNEFCVGDIIEVMKPDDRNPELTVAGMEDEESNV